MLGENMSSSDLDMALHRSVMERRRPLEEKQAREDAERRAAWYAEREQLGGARITKEKLKKILSSDRRLYYSTPWLNDKLYLHFGGYTQIENLENFNLKTLYIESNAIEKIENLGHMTKLRSLFIQENCVRSMTGLENLLELNTVNLSNNFVPTIEGVPPNLQTLQIANNQVGWNGLDDVRALIGTQINVLDIQGNKIQEPEILEEVLAKMPELRVLYLKGNPLVSKTKNYRKVVIAKLPQLTYLDDRPIFKDDRRCAEAFVRGGLEAEREERRKIKEEERDQHRRQHEAFARMCEEARRAGRERRDMMKEDKYTEETDPVDTYEKRMKRNVQGWEHENQDKIKDDAKERATRILKDEKEQGTGLYDPKLQAAYKKDEADRIPTRWNKKEEKSSGDATHSKKNTVYSDVWDDEEIVFDTAPQHKASSTVSSSTKAELAKQAEKLLSEMTSKVKGKSRNNNRRAVQELKNSNNLLDNVMAHLAEEEQEAVEHVKTAGADNIQKKNSQKKAELASEGFVRMKIEEEEVESEGGDDDNNKNGVVEKAGGSGAATKKQSKEKPGFSFNPQGRTAKKKIVQQNELDELD